MGERIRVECPKCHSQGAWYEKSEFDVTLRCLCGYCKVVQSSLDTVVIEHIDSEEEITLPRPNTKLWNCLAMLIGLQKADTEHITFRLNLTGKEKLTVSDVASQLTILRYKGLVEPVEVTSRGGPARRGMKGGSTWVPRAVAVQLFKGQSKE